MPTKSGGATIFEKILLYILHIPAGQKYLLHFQDKCFFAFNIEIQDGRQMWQENDFWETSPAESGETLWAKTFVQITLYHTVSEINMILPFNAEIQDGCQKLRENNFSRISRWPPKVVGKQFL